MFALLIFRELRDYNYTNNVIENLHKLRILAAASVEIIFYRSKFLINILIAQALRFHKLLFFLFQNKYKNFSN